MQMLWICCCCMEYRCLIAEGNGECEYSLFRKSFLSIYLSPKHIFMVIEYHTFNYYSKTLWVGLLSGEYQLCLQVFSCVQMYELFVVPERFIHKWVTTAKTSISTDLDIHTDKLGVLSEGLDFFKKSWVLSETYGKRNKNTGERKGTLIWAWRKYGEGIYIWYTYIEPHLWPGAQIILEMKDKTMIYQFLMSQGRGIQEDALHHTSHSASFWWLQKRDGGRKNCEALISLICIC